MNSPNLNKTVSGDRDGEGDQTRSQSPPVLPSNGQPEAQPAAAADLAQLLRAFAKIEGFVRPPLVRSEAGLHSGTERLLVVKSHRWKNFADTVARIDARHRQRALTLSDEEGDMASVAESAPTLQAGRASDAEGH